MQNIIKIVTFSVYLTLLGLFKEQFIMLKPGLLLTITLLIFPQLSETIYSPILPLLSDFFQVTSAQAQLTMGLYFAGFAVGVFLWGFVADKLGRRPAMLLGIIVYGFGALMAVFVDQFFALIVARVILALGASAGSVVTQTIIRDCYHSKALAKLFSLAAFSLSISPAVGPILGSTIASYWGVQGVLITLVILALFLYVWSYVSLPETRIVSDQAEKRSFFIILGIMITDKKLFFSAILVACMNILLFGYYTLGPFMVKYFGFSTAVFGFTGIVAAAGSMLGAMLNNKLLQFLTQKNIIILGSLCAMLGSLMQLGMGFILPESKVLSLCLMLSPILVIMIGFGLTISNVLSRALSAYQDVLGVAGALFGFAYYILISVGLWLLSKYYVSSIFYMPASFLVASIVALVASFFYALCDDQS